MHDTPNHPKRPRGKRGGRNFDSLPQHTKDRIQREKEAKHARNLASKNDDIWEALRRKMAATATTTSTNSR